MTLAAHGGTEASPRGGLDVLRARVTFRDRPVTEVLDLALRFIVVHGRSFAMVGLFALAPPLAIAIAVASRLGWGLAWVVAVPLAFAAEVPFTVLASRLAFQSEIRTREVFVLTARAGPGAFVARTLSVGLVLLGALVLVIPGCWLAVALCFVPEVLLLERAGLAVALGRAQRIAASAFSDVLVGVVLLSLIAIGCVLGADIAGRAVIGDLFQFRPPDPLWVRGGSVLALIGLFLQAPYVATARFFLYLNVRTRAEGWDIQTRFAAIANAEAGLEPEPTTEAP